MYLIGYIIETEYLQKGNLTVTAKHCNWLENCDIVLLRIIY